MIKAPDNKEDGFALVAVLIVISFLAILALTFAGHFRANARVAALENERMRNKLLFETALVHAVAGLTDPDQAAQIRALTGEPKYEPVEHDRGDELIAGSYVGKMKIERPPPVQVEGEKIEASLADPSMWTKRTTERITTTSADVYEKHGVPLTKGDNDRLIGKRRVHDGLAWKRDGEPLYPDERPGLQLFENCYNGIRTLPALPYDDVRVEDVDTGAEDHFYDALRYGLAYKVQGKRRPPRSGGNPWDAARRN